MTKILVVSDTHGNYRDVKNLISEIEGIDYIIHLGDGLDDIENILEGKSIKAKSVRGNCDQFYIGHPERLIIEENGFRILAVHGHRQRVGNNLNRLHEVAIEEGADLVLYGHTHVYNDEVREDIRFVSPGSPWRPRDDDFTRTVALITIDKDTKCIKDIIVEKIILNEM